MSGLINSYTPQYGVSFTWQTASTGAGYSPALLNTTGNYLKWMLSGDVAAPVTLFGVQSATHNLSTNTGTAQIDVLGKNGFVGLTSIHFYQTDGVSSFVFNNPINSLDTLHFSSQQINTVATIDLTNVPNITTLDIRDQKWTTIDLSGNALLTYVDIWSNLLPSGEVDQVIIDLDGHGLSNGTLNYDAQADPTAASLTAYNSLISKGWTITGAVPV